MAKEAAPIPFDEFAKRLPVIFDALAHQQEGVVVERDGKRYRIEPDSAPPTPPLATGDDLWADYDPERVLAGLLAGAGALAQVDTAQLLKELRAQREQDSQGRHD